MSEQIAVFKVESAPSIASVATCPQVSSDSKERLLVFLWSCVDPSGDGCSGHASNGTGGCDSIDFTLRNTRQGMPLLRFPLQHFSANVELKAAAKDYFKRSCINGWPLPSQVAVDYS